MFTYGPCASALTFLFCLAVLDVAPLLLQVPLESFTTSLSSPFRSFSSQPQLSRYSHIKGGVLLLLLQRLQRTW